MYYGENFHVEEDKGKVTLVNYLGNDKSVVVPEGITDIDRAFDGNSSIQSVTLPNGIISIGDYAFWNCVNLKNINIPDTVETIGENAFCDCKSLIDLSLPKGIKNIGIGAFYGCNQLSNVNVAGDVRICNAFSECESLPIIEGFQIVGNCIVKNCQNKSCFEIPDKITEIGMRSFISDHQLEKIIFNNNIESIGMFAFFDCKNLRSIDLPESIRFISRESFSNCPNLRRITWPDCDIETDGIILKKCAQDLEITFKFSKGGKIPPEIIRYLNKEKITNTEIAYLISFQGAKNGLIIQIL